MTFWLFTNIAPRALIDIFTYMSLHPVRGSHRACIIRSHRVFIIIPSGGTEFLTNSPFTRHGMPCQSNSLPTCVQLVGCQHLGQHIRPVLLCVDLRQHELSFFHSLLDPMVPALDVLRPRMVCSVFRKVDVSLSHM